MSGKNPKFETRDVPGLFLRAAFQPSSLNEESRTVDVEWGRGSPVLRNDWDGQYFEELSMDPASVRMDRLTSGNAPFLANHDGRSLDSVIGVVESARIENGVGKARVRFAKDDPAADAAFNKVRQGILKNISVGYRTFKAEKIKGDIPTYRAVDWQPYEVSLVPMGADSSASIRSVESNRTNPCVFVAPFEESSKMTEEEKRAAELKAEESRKAELKKATEDGARAESARRDGIRSAVTALRRMDAAAGDALETKLVSDNVSVDAARAAVLDALSARSDKTPVSNHGPVITVGTEQREKTLRGAEAALIQRAGLTQSFAVLKEKALKNKAPALFRNIETEAGEFGGMRLSRIAQEILERSGVSTRHMSDHQIVGMALTQRESGLSSASDFAVLLENIMYKSLLAAYSTQEDSWKKFCKTDTVQDFRPSNRYRTGSFGVLPVVAEGAEFVNTAIPDGLKSSISVQTKGQMIAISRQALVNDDLNALTEVTGRFGRMAGLTIETDVYALLTPNAGLGANFTNTTGTQAFFDSSNSNINATGSALGVQGIDADRVVLASQKDISGNEYLNLRPQVLLVPIGLGAQARTINFAEYDVTQSNKFMVPNIVRGLFAEVVDTPRLTGTRRYLFANPAESAAIVVAFLAGPGESPFMEQRLGWRVDGSEWKLRLDMKAQLFDPKGAVTNAGV